MKGGASAPSRRRFLGYSLALGGLHACVTGDTVLDAADARSVATNDAARPLLDGDQARAVATLAEAFCPSLAAIPGASAALAASVGHQLADDDRAAAEGRRELFLRGLSAVDRAARERFGAPVAALAREDASALFASMREGRIESDVPLGPWSAEFVGDVLARAAMSGPAYEQFGARVFMVLFA